MDAFFDQKVFLIGLEETCPLGKKGKEEALSCGPTTHLPIIVGWKEKGVRFLVFWTVLHLKYVIEFY